MMMLRRVILSNNSLLWTLIIVWSSVIRAWVLTTEEFHLAVHKNNGSCWSWTRTRTTKTRFPTTRRVSRDGDDDPPSPTTTVTESTSKSRRDVLLALLGGGVVTVTAEPASAGEIGAKITKAVTQSDVGISVRTSVVKGAQIMDKVDGQWEQLSDKFGLGSARSEQPGKPTPKIIPDPRPLDKTVASRIIDIADNTFLKLVSSNNKNVQSSDLQQQIHKVSKQVQPSFERSGLSKIDIESDSIISSGKQFDFVSYAHFKSYSDIILERNINFPSFKRSFEKQVGLEVLRLLLPAGWEDAKARQQSKCDSLAQALGTADTLCRVLVEKGLVASIDRSTVNDEDIKSWCESGDDLSFSIALDGDVTLSSQILLQEQGFRLYPNYSRFAIKSLLDTTTPSGGEPDIITIEDYYMDTDYNSDPDKFMVKEVLLNIELKGD